MSSPPRRGLPSEEDESTGTLRLPRILVASTVLSILCVLVAYLVWGPGPVTTDPATDPATASPSVSTSPSATSSVPTNGSTTPSGSPQPSARPLPTQSPTEPASPVTEPPETEPEVEPEPTALPAGTLKLDDTGFSAPQGWLLYGDDVIEGDRRMVRLSHTTTDVRLQAVSLLGQDENLQASCRALMDTQGEQFALTSEQLALPVGVDPTQGQGVTCGFSGVRLSDGIANTVTFSLVRRASDGNVLMLRHTVPDAVPAGDPARRDLVDMSCQASVGFGAPLPLC